MHTSKQCMSSAIWSTCGSGRFHITVTSFSTSAHMATGSEKHARWLTITLVRSEHILWLMSILNYLLNYLSHPTHSPAMHWAFGIHSRYLTCCCMWGVSLQKYSFIILSFFLGEVIRKRKEALKEEKELDRIQAKRNLDFLDILLLARVCG